MSLTLHGPRKQPAGRQCSRRDSDSSPVYFIHRLILILVSKVLVFVKIGFLIV